MQCVLVYCNMLQSIQLRYDEEKKQLTHNIILFVCCIERLTYRHILQYVIYPQHMHKVYISTSRNDPHPRTIPHEWIAYGSITSTSHAAASPTHDFAMLSSEAVVPARLQNCSEHLLQPVCSDSTGPEHLKSQTPIRDKRPRTLQRATHPMQ